MTINAFAYDQLAYDQAILALKHYRKYRATTITKDEDRTIRKITNWMTAKAKEAADPSSNHQDIIDKARSMTIEPQTHQTETITNNEPYKKRTRK